MKLLPSLIVLVGLLVAAIGVVGRFVGIPTISLAGITRSHEASSYLLMAILIILVGIFLAIQQAIRGGQKTPEAK